MLLDGNHEEIYLTRELATLRGLFAENSIVVFDDITEWEGVVEVFRQALQDDSFAEVGQDGRVWIPQVLTASHGRGQSSPDNRGDRFNSSESACQSKCTP